MKIFFVITSLIISICFCQPLMAQQAIVDGVTYRVDQRKKIAYAEDLDEYAHDIAYHSFVVINGTKYAVKEIRGNGLMLFGNKSCSVRNIVIEQGIERISRGAFLSCDSLKSISIPSSIIVGLDQSLFSGCSLSAIIVAKSNPVYTSHNGVLYNKDMTELLLYPKGKNDEKFTIPNSVKKLGWKAFSDNQYIQSIKCGTSLTVIGMHAINYCDNLKTVFMPKVELIDISAFEGCKQLNSIVLPKTLKKVCSDAFNRTGIKSITLSENVNEIGSSLSYKSETLSEINVVKDNPYFYSLNGIVYSKDKKRVITAVPMIQGTCSILDGIEIIEEGAFMGCSKITKFDFPESLLSIEKNAFWGCSSLEELYIPQNVRSIVLGRIDFLKSLKNFEVDADNEYYRSSRGALYNKDGSIFFDVLVRNDTCFAVKEGVKTIYNYAFHHYEKLKELVLPITLEIIEDNCFEGCVNLLVIKGLNKNVRLSGNTANKLKGKKILY